MVKRPRRLRQYETGKIITQAQMDKWNWNKKWKRKLEQEKAEMLREMSGKSLEKDYHQTTTKHP